MRLMFGAFVRSKRDFSGQMNDKPLLMVSMRIGKTQS